MQAASGRHLYLCLLGSELRSVLISFLVGGGGWRAVRREGKGLGFQGQMTRQMASLMHLSQDAQGLKHTRRQTACFYAGRGTVPTAWWASRSPCPPRLQNAHPHPPAQQ